MPDYPYPRSSAAAVQAACLANSNILLPTKVADEFCRVSDELERLGKLSSSGVPIPIDVKEFQGLWHKLTGHELSETDAEDYGRRIVIVVKHKKQRALEAKLRMILVSHRETPIEEEQVRLFMTVILMGFGYELGYEEAKSLLPGFMRTVWFDEGLDHSIDQALADLYAHYRCTSLGRKAKASTEYMYRETKISLEEAFRGGTMVVN